MGLNDWNHNGMYDSSDRYSDYRMSGGGNNNSGGGGLGVIGIAILCFAFAMELSKLWSGFIIIMIIVFIVLGVLGVY